MALMNLILLLLVARVFNLAIAGGGIVLITELSSTPLTASLFWGTYLVFEAFSIGAAVIREMLASDWSFFPLNHAERGTEIALDGRPPWADAEDRRLAKVASGISEKDDPNLYVP